LILQVLLAYFTAVICILAIHNILKELLAMVKAQLPKMFTADTKHLFGAAEPFYV